MRKWIAVLFFFTLGLLFLNISCQNNNTYQVYKIDQTKCHRCHQCVPKCGFNAITYTLDVVDTITGETLILGSVKIDPKKCVGCGECFRACPYHAINTGGQVDGTTGATR